jgi:hypothetical protein
VPDVLTLQTAAPAEDEPGPAQGPLFGELRSRSLCPA